MEQVELRANGLTFRALAAGSGGERRALLLHGFPDTPHSFRRLAGRLVACGYRVVAPWMRGYRPTEVPTSGDFQIAALASDVAGLLDTLQWEDAVVVGHDWGALATFAGCQLAPERIGAAVGLSLPPGRLFVRNALRHPGQWLRSWYILAIQLPHVPEWWLSREDFALLGELWRGEATERGVKAAAEAARRTFRQSGTLRAALGYYRALLPGRSEPLAEWKRSWRLATERIDRPSLLVAGGRDPAIGTEMFEDPERAFSSRWRLEVLEKAGHFVQLEAPERIADWIVAFDGNRR